jgi:hypothetical protein
VGVNVGGNGANPKKGLHRRFTPKKARSYAIGGKVEKVETKNKETFICSSKNYKSVPMNFSKKRIAKNYYTFTPFTPSKH